MSGLRAMLASPLDQTRLNDVSSPEFVMEPKYDGIRILIETRVDGQAIGRNRRGDRFTIPKNLTDLFSTISNNIVFDGELVGGVLHLFDMPSAGDQITVSSPWALRRRTLDKVLEHWSPPDALLQPVPFVRRADDKTGLIDHMRASGGEGVVAKRMAAPYRPGKRSRDWLKCKFTATVDCEVRSLGEVKQNMTLVLQGPDGPVSVGECTRLAGDGPHVKVGDVVTVQVLGVSGHGRLVQPTRPVRRTDKSPGECTVDQLDTIRRA